MFVYEIQAQSQSIKSDPVFIQYENAYIKYVQDVNPILNELDILTRDFYGKFDHKQLNNFNKSGDKNKWLSKNWSKLKFDDLNQATFMYDSILRYKNFQNERSQLLTQYLNELLLKYDRNTIYNTLKDRIMNKE